MLQFYLSSRQQLGRGPHRTLQVFRFDPCGAYVQNTQHDTATD